MTALALLLLPAAPLAAEIIPEPGAASPRIQTVRWQEGQTIQLTALPATSLTLVFEPGEAIVSVNADTSALSTHVSSDRDALQITPHREGALGSLEVITARRSYAFTVRAASDLMAAYLVRLQTTSAMPTDAAPAFPLSTTPRPPLPQTIGAAPVIGQKWSYRMRGDRTVRPAAISDDGRRTIITFAEDSALPAVLVIGPAGEEQLANGYMRGEHYVIDQVWNELVFRIDDRRATAKRDAKPGAPNG